MKKKAPSYHHGDLKNAVSKSAMGLLSKKGVEGLSLREIAKRVGVTPTALYRHYKDKNALLAEIAESGFSDLYESVTVHLASCSKPTEALKAFGLAYLKYGIEHPLHFQLMFSQNLSDRSKHKSLQAMAHKLVVLLKERVALCLKPSRHKEVERLALTFWSALHGACELIFREQTPENMPPLEFGEQILDTILQVF